jgi:type VI secretion system protein ImpH
MAPHGWRKSPSVGAWLEAQGEVFDFFQAVALLENEAQSAADEAKAPAGVGAGPSPHREAVKLRSSIAMSFPPSDIERVRRLPDGKTEVTARVMGLAGALGPLPPPYSELVARRAANRDLALRDFLDIFHHRLLSIFYRARKQHRVGLGVRSPVEASAARHLFALLGLGTPGLHDRLGVPDRALLHHAGTLARPVRPMAGLEVLLRRHFGVGVRGRPLTGRLCPIEQDDRTAIGRSGRRRALGRDAVIGERVWIQDAAFEIVVGPLESDQVGRFLPGGDALRPLCSLVDVYAGDTSDYTLCILADPSARKQARLGRAHGSRLGYTSWLGRTATGGRSREVRLSVTTLARFRGQEATVTDGGAQP